MNKSKNKKISSRRGFSLVEMLVAIFIFSLMALATSATLVKSFSAYKRAKNIQKNLEDAQYAIALMSKTLRESVVVSVSGTVSNITAYSYSQKKCIKYSFNSSSGRLESGSVVADDLTACTSSTSISTIPLTGQFVNTSSSRFYVVPSVAPVPPTTPGTVGRVTISMEICSAQVCSTANTDKARIQSTVSLRNYATSAD
jgi:prepilin-type N-terminal cleavage/methylation domain-containing protein